MHYRSPFWGPRVISMINEPWDAFTCRSSTLTILADSGPFHALLLTVLGVPDRFPRLTIPGLHVRVRRQHSQFWPILYHFMDYYSPFWGPKVISILVRPQGALTCRSSTLAVLAGSRPFHRLLLAILESWSDYHD